MSAGDLSPDPPTWPAELVAERDELAKVRAAVLSHIETLTAERDAWRTWWLQAALASERDDDAGRRAEADADEALAVIRQIWPDLDTTVEAYLEDAGS